MRRALAVLKFERHPDFVIASEAKQSSLDCRVASGSSQ